MGSPLTSEWFESYLTHTAQRYWADSSEGQGLLQSVTIRRPDRRQPRDDHAQPGQRLASPDAVRDLRRATVGEEPYMKFDRILVLAACSFGSTAFACSSAQKTEMSGRETVGLEQLSGCGVCSGTCTATGCLVTVASGQQQPVRIALNSANVYWLTTWLGPPNPGVMMAPVAGGSATMLYQLTDGDWPWPYIASASGERRFTTAFTAGETSSARTTTTTISRMAASLRSTFSRTRGGRGRANHSEAWLRMPRTSTSRGTTVRMVISRPHLWSRSAVHHPHEDRRHADPRPQRHRPRRHQRLLDRHGHPEGP